MKRMRRVIRVKYTKGITTFEDRKRLIDAVDVLMDALLFIDPELVDDILRVHGYETEGLGKKMSDFAHEMSHDAVAVASRKRRLRPRIRHERRYRFWQRGRRDGVQ